MSPEQKKNFIEDALYHELSCLLQAAALWRALKNSGIAGHEISIAMDSAFVHARSLFIFFASTKGDKENSNSAKMTDFGIQKAYQSRLYSDSKEALNRHVFHLSKRRLKPTNLKGSGLINSKVQTFAEEILKLWEKFEEEKELGDLKDIVQTARERAIKDADYMSNGIVASILKIAQALKTQSSVLPAGENKFVS